MKSILMSIQPKWCEKIINGEKTIEVRKTAPKEVPFKVYIYCTYGRGKGKSALYFDAYGNVSRKANGVKWINGKVIGEFVCDKVDTIPVDSECYKEILKDSCLTMDEIINYCKGKGLKALHITALKIYDKPRELGEFGKYCIDYGKDLPFCNCHCSSECYKAITRPPQSWQYVEEVEE